MSFLKNPDFKDLLAAFDEAQVQYLVVGGHAVGFHARARTIMNILRHELPDTDRSSDVVAFATAATVYGVLLLSLSPGS